MDVELLKKGLAAQGYLLAGIGRAIFAVAVAIVFGLMAVVVAAWLFALFIRLVLCFLK